MEDYKGTKKRKQYHVCSCLLSLLIFSFEGKLGLGTGTATRFAKAPAGISAFSGETKGFPQREAEGPRPPPDLMEKPPPRGFAKRGAVPVPRRGLRSIRSPFVF